LKSVLIPIELKWKRFWPNHQPLKGTWRLFAIFALSASRTRAWSLLLLEFKLFAMRHPESKKRLQSVYAGILSRKDEKRLANIIGAAAKGKDAISRVIAIQSMQPVISALVLEAQLETNLSEKNVLRNVVHRIFDALLEVSPR
jgi:hypothetical protein